MTKRTRVVLIAVVWALSLVAVGTWARAQEATQQAVLYAGDDLGVRVYTPMSTGQPQATLVIRVAGKWQEVELKRK